MRVLFASTALAGHLTPLLPFLTALERRGDPVLLVVPPGLEATIQSSLGATPLRIAGAPPAEELAAIWERVPRVSRAEASELINREIFGRLCTAALLPAVDQACRDWRPELVLREPCEYASAVTAARLGIRQAQVGISPAAIEESALGLVGPVLEPYREGVVDVIRASAYVTRFPASLDPSPFPDTRRFREETAVGAETDPLPDWWSGSDAPLIYMTFGSVAGDLPIAASAFRAGLAAVEPLPVRVLLTVGRAFDPRLLGPIPGNVHVEPWVPQARVLARAAVVVCHGGSGTAFGSLAVGVPLVIIPLFADQPANARSIASAGAGLVVAPDPGGAEAGMPLLGAADVPRIRAAIEAVLAGTAYRDAARRIAEEMRSLPTIGGVLDTLASA